MQSLVYQPINASSEIRLLEIALESDKVEWRLRPGIGPNVTDKFAATSYVWGDPDQKIPFFVGSERVQVPLNLWHFLQELPGHIQSNPDLPRLFWIDSICIDQGNEWEKASQIRLQGDIYQKATCVLSWLGPSCDSSDLAMDYLNKYYCSPVRDPYGCPSTVVIQCLDSLLNRPNWTRIWIVQEVLLAQKIWILCGSKFVDEYRLSSLISNPPFNSRLLSNSSASKLLEERRLFKRSGASPLKDLLYKFCTFQSTYRIDKIYALLGLCSDPIDKMCDLRALFFNCNTKTYDLETLEKIREEIVLIACQSTTSQDAQDYWERVTSLLGLRPMLSGSSRLPPAKPTGRPSPPKSTSRLPPPKPIIHQDPAPDPFPFLTSSTSVPAAAPRFDQIQPLSTNPKDSSIPTQMGRPTGRIVPKSRNASYAIPVERYAHTTIPSQDPKQAQARYIGSTTQIPRCGDATPLREIVRNATHNHPQISHQGASKYTGGKSSFMQCITVPYPRRT